MRHLSLSQSSQTSHVLLCRVYCPPSVIAVIPHQSTEMESCLFIPMLHSPPPSDLPSSKIFFFQKISFLALKKISDNTKRIMKV